MSMADQGDDGENQIEMTTISLGDLDVDERVQAIGLDDIEDFEEVMPTEDVLPTIKEEEEEENFVMSALHHASEEGNMAGINELLENSPNFDLNQANKHGETAIHMAASGGHLEVVKLLKDKGVDLTIADKHGDTAVYWAARQGHVKVISYLKDQGVCLNTQNKAGEAAIHVAARYGHLNVLNFLCSSGADVNLKDKLGELALHTAAWHGLPAQICAQLCVAGSSVDSQNKDLETPLHCAAARGNLECVKVLLSHGASLNVVERKGCSPLNLACKRRHIPIALLLVHSGANMDVLNSSDESALHPACREGLLPVVQTMCAFGCQVDVVNKAGLTPLHLAAKMGHTEIVRCLLLSGADPDLEKDGVKAEIMAFAQGNNETAELLYRMRPDRRETCIKQLIPTNEPLSRIKVKVFGPTGSGKTTLVDSLKCGYVGSFFRKVRLSNTSNTHIKQKSLDNGAGIMNTVPRQNSLPTQLSFDYAHEAYTRGIDVQQLTLTACGDLSVWEFSGYEPYYLVYDHFIGDPNCIHLVTFSLAETQEDQLAQLVYWFNFIKARIAPMEPIGFGGRHPWPPHVILIATHADIAKCRKNSNGEFESAEARLLLETMKQKFSADFNIHPQVFVVDAHSAMSAEMKALRVVLGEVKQRIVQNLPCGNGFLEAAVQALPNWRRVLPGYPVVTWPRFIEYVRSKVNLLASEEHLKELMCQLQLVGEVVYVETEAEEDLVVLHPQWLCSEVIGQLLSHDLLSTARPTGCFSADDFQLLFPDSDVKDLLCLLEALELCTRCDVEGEVEYEFPCLNFIETLHGLWERDDTRLPQGLYGGVRLQCPAGVINQLVHLFPRIQAHLRCDLLENNNGPDCDLYQWYHGTKFCKGSMEALVTLEQKEQVLEVKVRGSEACRAALYYFLEEISDVVSDVLEDACPGIALEKHVLSPNQLKAHKKAPLAYSPKDLLSTQNDRKDSCRLNDSEPAEKLTDLLCCGAAEIGKTITLGIDLHISHMSVHLRRKLSSLLDPPDCMGKDWCLLAVGLGLTEDLPKLDQTHPQSVSRTDGILALWSREASSNIRSLLLKLRELGRQDAVDTVLMMAPLYHVFPEDQDGGDSEDLQKETTPHSSDNTIASR